MEYNGAQINLSINNYLSMIIESKGDETETAARVALFQKLAKTRKNSTFEKIEDWHSRRQQCVPYSVHGRSSLPLNVIRMHDLSL